MPARQRLRIGAGNASLRPGEGKESLAHIAVMLRGLTGGGAERVALAVAGGLAGRGHRVDLAFPDSPERFYPARIPEGVCAFLPGDGVQPARFRMPDSAVWLTDSPGWRERLGLALGLARRRGRFLLLRRRALRRALALMPYLRRERPDIVFANSPSVELSLYILTQNQRCTPPPPA